MTTSDVITLFHAPQSRSSATLTLLEELGVPYDLHVLNMKAGEQRQSAFLAINPMGKVPAILHRGELVTEQVACFIYLADLFPEAGLAPHPGDPRRGPYLRWLVFYAACYEPGMVDVTLKREPGPPAMSPYGDFETVLGTLIQRLGGAPYLLGETISAADVLWGTALQWGMLFKIVPEHPVLVEYAARIAARPAFARVSEADAMRASEHEAALAVQG
jgi:glutathione S-transferase